MDKISTAALGALGCLVLMFYINAAYAGVTIGTFNVSHHNVREN